MAESKRAGKHRRRAGKPERLTALNFVANAAAAFVVAPALFVSAAMLLLEPGRFGGAELNQPMFLGLVATLVGVFLLLLSGLKVWEHVKARRRFRELLEGDRKSAVVQNIDELTTLARALGPPYRRRLEGRLDEMGVKR